MTEGEGMTTCERFCYAEIRLKKQGWIQGTYRLYGKPSGAACLVGSLLTDEEYEGGYPILSVDEAVQTLGFEGIVGAVEWNDTPGRRVEEVFDRLAEGKKRACV